MDNEAKSIFAERLRYIREDVRRITQTELSAKAGLPTTTISHFENPTGTRKPSFDNLRLLAKHLDVTTDYLLGLSEDMGGGAVTNRLYRDVQNLSEKDKEFAEMMIKNLAEKGK
jgi:transcriptional regulator with XRE-family HTH domain